MLRTSSACNDKVLDFPLAFGPLGPSYRPDTFDLLQETSFGVLCFCELFDLSVVLSDRLIHSFDLLQRCGPAWQFSLAVFTLL